MRREADGAFRAGRERRTLFTCVRPGKPRSTQYSTTQSYPHLHEGDRSGLIFFFLLSVETEAGMRWGMRDGNCLEGLESILVQAQSSEVGYDGEQLPRYCLVLHGILRSLRSFTNHRARRERRGMTWKSQPGAMPGKESTRREMKDHCDSLAPTQVRYLPLVICYSLLICCFILRSDLRRAGAHNQQLSFLGALRDCFRLKDDMRLRSDIT